MTRSGTSSPPTLTPSHSSIGSCSLQFKVASPASVCLILRRTAQSETRSEFACGSATATPLEQRAVSNCPVENTQPAAVRAERTMHARKTADLIEACPQGTGLRLPWLFASMSPPYKKAEMFGCFFHGQRGRQKPTLSNSLGRRQWEKPSAFHWSKRQLQLVHIIDFHLRTMYEVGLTSVSSSYAMPHLQPDRHILK